MNTITVTNQSELDAACAKQAKNPSILIEIRSNPSSRVEARGSSRVEAWDSSRVVAWGSSRVVARGSSRVEARGSSRVEAWDSSRVDASARVAIHRMNSRTRIKGGVVIDCTEPITTVEAACAEWLITPKRGRSTVYKAVNDKLESERGFVYPIGESVKCADWDERVACGNGLHFSPTPNAAKRYFPQATRFLECSVLVKDAVLCGEDVFPDKLKARAAKVIREVDMWGDPV